jgi:hypothetical protein
VDKVDELLIAVIGPWGYCRGAVTSLLWPTISELVRAAHGPICCVCIASILALEKPRAENREPRLPKIVRGNCRKIADIGDFSR